MPPSFDLFKRTPADLLSSSKFTSLLTLLTALILSLLFLVETISFFTPLTTTTTHLDFSPTITTLRLNFNLTFPELDCTFISLDVTDVLGTNSKNITQSVDKYSIDDTGKKHKYKGRQHLPNNEVLHDHDVNGENNRHGTIEELLVDGEHASAVAGAEGLAKILEEREYVFMDFYAPWCSWCQRLEPTWERFAEEIESSRSDLRTIADVDENGKKRSQFEKIAVAKFDCVDSMHVCGEQGIVAFPTLRLFHFGEKWGGDFKGDRTLEGFRTHLNQAYNAIQSAKEEFKSYPGQPQKSQANLNLKFKTGHKNLARISQVNSDWHAADHSGCEISGYLKVNRYVPGTFFIEASSKFQDMIPSMQNVSHTVNHFSVGTPLTRSKKKKLEKVPNNYKRTNNLDGQSFITTELHTSHHHNLDLVHTNFERKKSYLLGMINYDDSIFFTQYLTQSQLIHQDQEEVVEARFTYDLSPISISLKMGCKPWYDYLTTLSALIGGTFSVFKMLTTWMKHTF